jgi:hypothetical protein
MKTQLQRKIEEHIARECTAIDREERFDNMLDECYSFTEVGGPFAHMSPSSVLRYCDPTTYRCGVNDYEDSEGWVEVGGDYYEQEEAEEALESFIDEIRDEIATMESDIEDMDEEEDAEQIKEMQADLDKLQAKLAEAEAYSL